MLIEHNYQERGVGQEANLHWIMRRRSQTWNDEGGIVHYNVWYDYLYVDYWVDDVKEKRLERIALYHLRE